MTKPMIALGIITGIIVLAGIAQLIELRLFRLTPYEIRTPKVKNPLRLMLIADLHGFSYGRDNERLFRAIRDAKPDLVLIGGDLIVKDDVETYDSMTSFACKLPEIAPVYFAFGNHESKAKSREIPEFAVFEETLQKNGIVFLHNECRTITVKDDTIALYGLELPLSFYEKRKKQTLPASFLEKTIGFCDKTHFSILLAHNPAYGDDYFRWGADLTLSGHTHGGLVRFPGGRSILSPELLFFPKYDGGHYRQADRHLIVSKGLGTHTFHIRIFDRAEAVLISIKP